MSDLTDVEWLAGKPCVFSDIECDDAYDPDDAEIDINTYCYPCQAKWYCLHKRYDTDLSEIARLRRENVKLKELIAGTIEVGEWLLDKAETELALTLHECISGYSAFGVHVDECKNAVLL